MARTKRSSFEKFNYLLRPSKQVERKLIIEILHRLATGGVPIADYTYLGFGSVYYADFTLFHKYLYIKDMICVEKSDIPKRMAFNKPFDFVRLEMKEVAQVVPDLDRERRYVVWLDYDYGLTRDVLADIDSFFHVLAPGCVFIVTVDAEPRLPEGLDDIGLTEDVRDERLLQMYKDDLGKYVRGKIRRNILTPNSLPVFLAGVLRTQFREASRRRGLRFHNLFNFTYADGAQMLSLGGVLANPAVGRAVRRSGVFDLPFATDRSEPTEIYVPPLTIREKHWLEQNLREGLDPGDLEFELAPEYLDSFRRYYKQYPMYYETLA